MDKNKIIISASLTGGATNRSHCPAIPYTPVELGEEARRAHEAGASIVHIHAREDNGVPSWRPEVFAEIQREVRKHCPDILKVKRNFCGMLFSKILLKPCRRLFPS